MGRRFPREEPGEVSRDQFRKRIIGEELEIFFLSSKKGKSLKAF